MATYVSTGAAAKQCGVATLTIGNWIRKGRLSAFRTPGGRFRVALEDVQALIARGTVAEPKQK